MNFGIIAAGEGSRLLQEGVKSFKPLVKLNGEPMIERLVRIFKENGAEKICIIVNEKMTPVREFVEQLQSKSEVPIEVVVKSTPSSMHSFYEIGKLLKGHGRFIVTTVDTIFREPDFAKYVKDYEDAPTDVDGMMAVTSFVDDEKPLYVLTDSEMNIKAFMDESRESRESREERGEIEDRDEREFVSGGIYGLGDKAVAVLDECLQSGVSRMRNYQRALVATGLKLKACDMGKIIDVDHAGDIAKAEKFLETNG